MIDNDMKGDEFVAKFCSEDCHIICDFCKHYIDEYHDRENEFAGEGICDIDNHATDASGGCDNFECFRIE